MHLKSLKNAGNGEAIQASQGKCLILIYYGLNKSEQNTRAYNKHQHTFSIHEKREEMNNRRHPFK